jgi:hypothetical protein
MVNKFCIQFLFLLAIALSLATITFGQERDILDIVAEKPLGMRVQNPDGSWRTPKYGDYRLENAVEALKGRSRPFTVSKVIKWYAQERNGKKRSHLLSLLAASRDPRAAVALGNAISDDNLDVRIATLDGLQFYFVETVVSGGSEDTFMHVEKWWKDNRVRLETEAKALEKRN